MPAGDWPTDPGDESLLATANLERRVLVTLDKDFGELAVVRGLPHHGIIRLVGVRGPRQARICQAVLARHSSELAHGALITAEPSRLRIRAPDDSD